MYLGNRKKNEKVSGVNNVVIMKIESGNIKITMENFYNDYWKREDCKLQHYKNEQFVASKCVGKYLTDDEMVTFVYDYINDRNKEDLKENRFVNLSDKELRGLKIEILLI